ncbi:hypothetical protein M3Y99_01376200 [Aphelenchoides fujianensis]|nr:hypothetical protein M3Y99_01376200 [Aphelenchoides fujianensis]
MLARKTVRVARLRRSGHLRGTLLLQPLGIHHSQRNKHHVDGGKLPFWKAEGGVLIDRVAFHDNFTVGGDDSPHVFAVENARRPYYDIAGYFGLAPGKYNLVVQAYAQGHIPAPVLAYYGDATLYFGGLPRDAPCADWAHFPTFQNKWQMRMAWMQFLNLTVQVHFTYEWDEDEDNSVYFSDEIIERALKAGLLVREANEKDVYRANCSTDLTALMVFGDQQFEFTLPSLQDGDSCELTIGRFRFFGARNNGIVYTDTPTC